MSEIRFLPYDPKVAAKITIAGKEEMEKLLANMKSLDCPICKLFTKTEYKAKSNSYIMIPFRDKYGNHIDKYLQLKKDGELYNKLISDFDELPTHFIEE